MIWGKQICLESHGQSQIESRIRNQEREQQRLQGLWMTTGWFLPASSFHCKCAYAMSTRTGHFFVISLNFIIYLQDLESPIGSNDSRSKWDRFRINCLRFPEIKLIFVILFSLISHLNCTQSQFKHLRCQAFLSFSPFFSKYLSVTCLITGSQFLNIALNYSSNLNSFLAEMLQLAASSLFIVNCLFVSSHAYSLGGGVYVSVSSWVYAFNRSS